MGPGGGVDDAEQPEQVQHFEFDSPSKPTIATCTKVTPAPTRIVCRRFSKASAMNAPAFGNALSCLIEPQAQCGQHVALFRRIHPAAIGLRP